MTVKYFISSTGLCGTTVLIKLFEELGYEIGNTHYPNANPEFLKDDRVFYALKKGEEVYWPEVIKHLGGGCYNLTKYVKDWNWKLEHVFIPLRTIDQSLNKRFAKPDKYIRSKSFGISNDLFNSLSEVEKIDGMRNILFKQIGSLIFQCIELDVPITILNYPRFVLDKEYCWSLLDDFIEGPMTWKKFDKAFTKIVDPEKVHEY